MFSSATNLRAQNAAPFTHALDSAIDAAVSVRDTTQNLQVIEYRQRLLMERLIVLSHSYSELYRTAARHVATAVAVAEGTVLPQQLSHHNGALVTAGLHPLGVEKENNRGGNDATASGDADVVEVSGPAATSSSSSSVSSSAATARLASSNSVAAAALANVTSVEAISVLPCIADAFAALMVHASATATTAAVGGGGSGGSNNSKNANASTPPSSVLAFAQLVAPLAQQLVEMRSAIRAMETELEMLANARCALVNALSVL